MKKIKFIIVNMDGSKRNSSHAALSLHETSLNLDVSFNSEKALSHDKNYIPLTIPNIMTELKLGKYEHYKGKQYEVIGLARHSETLEELVIYKALYDSEEFGNNTLWARPKSMFLENINIDGKEIPRFRYIR